MLVIIQLKMRILKCCIIDNSPAKFQIYTVKWIIRFVTLNIYNITLMLPHKLMESRVCIFLRTCPDSQGWTRIPESSLLLLTSILTFFLDCNGHLSESEMSSFLFNAYHSQQSLVHSPCLIPVSSSSCALMTNNDGLVSHLLICVCTAMSDPFSKLHCLPQYATCFSHLQFRFICFNSTWLFLVANFHLQLRESNFRCWRWLATIENWSCAFCNVSLLWDHAASQGFDHFKNFNFKVWRFTKFSFYLILLLDLSFNSENSRKGAAIVKLFFFNESQFNVHVVCMRITWP